MRGLFFLTLQSTVIIFNSCVRMYYSAVSSEGDHTTLQSCRHPVFSVPLFSAPKNEMFKDQVAGRWVRNKRRLKKLKGK